MLAILLVVNSHAAALAVTLVLAAALKFCSGRVSRLVGIGR